MDESIIPKNKGSVQKSVSKENMILSLAINHF